MRDSEEVADFTKMDDSTLLSWRAEARTRLEHLPPLSPAYFQLSVKYDASTAIIDGRARTAWTRKS